jgi:hypothetical protein
MGLPTLEVGYTSATTGSGDHEAHKGHVVALGEKVFFEKKTVEKIQVSLKSDKNSGN